MSLILLNKPFRVLAQFRDNDGRSTLADFVAQPSVYPAGRLDYDSEGLLLLTDHGPLQARISQPTSKIAKTYWAQIEGEATDAQLAALELGVTLRDGPARALRAVRRSEPPDLWARNPAVRVRKTVPDSWLEIVLDQGRNRQLRRMTASVGLPTLRLIRAAVGPWSLGSMQPGETRSFSTDDAWSALRNHQRLP